MVVLRRRDNHSWRKKKDGKTVRETHEKLKVGNADVLNCYYAHAAQDDGLQVRLGKCFTLAILVQPQRQGS